MNSKSVLGFGLKSEKNIMNQFVSCVEQAYQKRSNKNLSTIVINFRAIYGVQP